MTRDFAKLADIQLSTSRDGGAKGAMPCAQFKIVTLLFLLLMYTEQLHHDVTT